EVPKKRGDGMTNKSASTELTMPDGRIVSNTEANDEIIEIIGLDRGQFVKIAMIAQGDFLKILLASTEEKRGIFRKIFSTENYQVLQDSLSSEANRLKKVYDTQSGLLTAEYSDIVCDPVDAIKASLVEKAQNGDMPAGEVVDLIGSLLDTDRGRMKDIDAAIDGADKQITTLRGEIITALNFEKTQKLLETSQKELPDAEKAEKVSKAAYDVELKKQPEQEELLKRLTEIENQLPNYEKLEGLKSELEKTKKFLSADTEARDMAESRSKKIESETQMLTEEKKGYASAETDKVKLQGEIEKLSERKKDIDSLVSEFKTLDVREKELHAAQDDYVRTEAAAEKAGKKYEAEFKAHMDSQAGILARELSDGKPCPVCGSLEHPRPAKTAGEVLSKEEIDTLKKAADETRERMSKASADASKKKGAYDTQLENVKKAAEKMFPGEDAEDVRKKLTDEARNIDGRMHELRGAIAVEDQRIKRNNDIEGRLSQLDGEGKKCAALISELSGKVIKEEADINNLTLSAKSVSMGLPFESLERANTEIKSIEAQRKNMAEALDAAKKDYEGKSGRVRYLENNIDHATEILRGYKPVDIAAKKDEEARLSAEKSALNAERDRVNVRISANERVKKNISGNIEEIEKTEKRLTWLKALSDTANGQLTGKQKITLEAYVQSVFFDRVLGKANRRFLVMSGNQYELVRSEKAKDKRGQAGLDLDVVDHFNGTRRSVNTLSGGESFEASLSLALGLSDEVQSIAGGIELDVMFVDEGFGTLSEDVLELALKALNDLSAGEGGRLVGIISHVTELKNRIEKKIVVTKDRDKGSRIEISTD
ncbi:MAG: SMC family ATPase, partial [Clostridia bacterium]|nr:SMC family ATPase [Clostridia bacterium]